ncbi:hypothetical protein [Actinoplanes sp. URMC 104]|uniref:hypothetical protein n=1 Tax=Actinoplanes sp. URMC 104 TaxID=3423409 RepID=UPI003F1D4B31
MALLFSGGRPMDLQWLAEPLRDGGMSTLRIDPASGPTNLDGAIAYAAALAGNPGPVGVVAVGADAGDAWRALAAGARLRGAVMIGVPGVDNLDFAKAREVPVLDLHAVTDTVVDRAHGRTHGALALVGVPHEMVKYGSVRPAFYDPASPDWAGDTARDAAGRAVSWLGTAFTTGMTVQPGRSSR